MDSKVQLVLKVIAVLLDHKDSLVYRVTLAPLVLQVFRANRELQVHQDQLELLELLETLVPRVNLVLKVLKDKQD